MNKISVNGYFKNYEMREKILFETTGYLINENIVFKQDKNFYKLFLKTNKIVFHKENNDSKLIYSFQLKKQTLGSYVLKETNTKITIPIHTSNLIRNHNKIKIDFELEQPNNNKNIFYLEYEVCE